MKEPQNHKALFKNTSLFGLVELLRMALKVVTNKFASIFLGVSGVGLIGLIENTVQLLQAASSFGIQFTGVRDLAIIENPTEEFHKKFRQIRWFSLAGGCVSALLSVVLAVQLSQLTFDDASYSWWFLGLSIYFIANSIINSRTILLEATQSVQKLLVLSAFSSMSSSIVVVGSYYYFHINGIVIALIATSIVNLAFYVFATRKQVQNVVVTAHEFWQQGKTYLFSGSFLAANTFFGLFCFFILRLYFKDVSPDEGILGYYQVGTVFINAYLGMIFIAMGKFFYPKLAQLSSDIEDRNRFVNDQLEINILIILPALLFVYVFGHELISLLFASTFAPVYQILIFGLFSVLVKGFNYSLGYLILSQNHIKTYFYVNLFSDFFNLILTVFLFQYLELMGIGLALVINYLCSALYMFVLAKKKYQFYLYPKNKRALWRILAVALVVLLTYFLWVDWIFRIVCLVLFLVTALHSVKQLDQYVFDARLHRFFKNKNKK